MKKIACLLFLFSISCDDNVQLTRYCQEKTACWLPPGTENNQSNIIFEIDSEKYEGRPGFCGTGIVVCEEDTVRCENVRYPKEEMCDGKDNDCNGIIDDPDKFWAGVANAKCYFEETGECKYSEQACINGELVCLYETSPSFGPEICDGKDNDCDGEYDEDYQAQFVYTAAVETASVGECRPGVTRCIDGKEQIFGMVLPRSEICNNKKDDDCDGLEDEPETGLASVDYAFFIDFSGSMLGLRLDSVIDSVCSFSGNPIFADSRFAIVAIGVSSYGSIFLDSDQHGLYLVTDFTDIISACNSLDEFIDQGVFSALDEYQLDAILRSFGDYPTSLSWSDRDRKLYIFSDEPAQAINTADIPQAIDDIIEMCTENSFEIGIFTELTFFNFGWDRLLNGCGGFVEEIDSLSDESYFEENFLIWFGGSC